jgi:tetratricopeptide (TPR) repeat protein
MTKRWAESDLRFLRDNAGKMDVQSLADRLGATLGEVETKMEKLGLVSENGSGSFIKKPASFREMFKHSEAARKEYEKGAAALQKKKFEEAEKHFRAVLDEFGDERELADRSRLYLAVCERRKKGARPAGGSDGDDSYYAALLEKNRKNFQGAIEQLKKSKKSDDGRAAYLLACCFAQLNDADRALEALERAIAADESNRTLARRDPDFEPVRETAEFLNLTAATA